LCFSVDEKGGAAEAAPTIYAATISSMWAARLFLPNGLDESDDDLPKRFADNVGPLGEILEPAIKHLGYDLDARALSAMA
jgi:hypothetical protein